VTELLIYLLLGAVAGVVAGMLGVGGGLIIVPVVAAVLFQHGVAPDLVMPLALGTSLATIILTSLSSVRAHHARGAVLWPTVVRLAPGIVLGAWLGAWVAHGLRGDALRIIFGLFALAVAAQMALNVKPSAHRQLPGTVGTGAAGGVIGFVSAIVGIGGGSLTVPFLLYCNVAMRNAVGTSAACGLPIALAGAAGFIWNGWGVAGLPAGSLGYLYLPAFGGVAAASMLFAPLGARLAHRLPADRLKRIFAVLLAFIGLRMLWA
jgi:uncharacterized membrane protein YfcA